MYYVYVLLSLKNYRLYVGSTSNLKQRIKEHNQGIGGTYTKNNRLFKLIYYEAFISKSDMLSQEKFYKTGYGREVLRGKINHSLKIARSSNGRTADSESAYPGSSPGWAT